MSASRCSATGDGDSTGDGTGTAAGAGSRAQPAASSTVARTSIIRRIKGPLSVVTGYDGGHPATVPEGLTLPLGQGSSMGA